MGCGFKERRHKACGYRRKKQHMKKIYLILLTVFVFTPLKADSFYNYGGDWINKGKFQAYYKEKYFEYDYQYANDVGDSVGQTDMLSGISQTFGVRYGLDSRTVLDCSLLYMFQELQETNPVDFNSPQLFNVMIERYNYDGPGIICGLRLPIQNKVINNGRFIYDDNKFNAVLGILKQDYIKWFFYSYQAVAEQCLEFNAGYNGEVDLSAAAGYTFSDDPEKQKIDFIIEGDYHTYDYNGQVSKVFTVAPEFNVNFFDDFAFVLGVEQIVYADSIVLNPKNVLLYLLKVNYLINSDKRLTKKDED